MKCFDSSGLINARAEMTASVTTLGQRLNTLLKELVNMAKAFKRFKTSQHEIYQRFKHFVIPRADMTSMVTPPNKRLNMLLIERLNMTKAFKRVKTSQHESYQRFKHFVIPRADMTPMVTPLNKRLNTLLIERVNMAKAFKRVKTSQHEIYQRFKHFVIPRADMTTSVTTLGQRLNTLLIERLNKAKAFKRFERFKREMSQRLKRWVLTSSALILTLLSLHLSAAALSCQGRFMNPVTDICWNCVFPISIGGVAIATENQIDINNPSDSVCFCDNPPRVGIAMGFWEPHRLVDVTRIPFCLVGLGGLLLDPGIDVPRGAQVSHDSKVRSSFYQAHWYTNPILYWLQTLLDFPCLEAGSLDVVYLTEFDPLWSDDELSAILNPEAVLFANPAAIAACAADCVAASTGFPLAGLFWCAGCQGSLYPLTGHVANHIGGVAASTLITERFATKMHRELITFSGAGHAGLCGYYPQPLMDKTQYKLQMIYPVPNTQTVNGQCCQPVGRSTLLWGAGKEFPVSGEDFSYQIFRKRNCCASGR